MALPRESYTIGWIATLKCEIAAAQAMLVREHPPMPYQDPNDPNNYILGSIGPHNVVLACLSKAGTNSAAYVAANMLRSFPNIRIGLLVGVGGGVPKPKNTDQDIRLGDVVVSYPTAQHGGVIQYDYGTTTRANGGPVFNHKGHLNKPPQILLNALSSFQAAATVKGPTFERHYETMLENFPNMLEQYSRPDVDRLYRSDYLHQGKLYDCSECSEEALIDRPDRSSCIVHYGLIGSANVVLRDAEERDRLHTKEGIICFEMEAAGIMDDFHCVVIRGISDYCDTHKSKNWQPFAGAMAAAFAKELLLKIPASVTAQLEALADKLGQLIHRGDQQLRRDLRNWLATSVDSAGDFKRISQQRLQGTCGWVLQNDVFRQWMQKDTSTGGCNQIWLNGIPGAGKTFLFTRIVEYLSERQYRAAIIYCSQDNQNRSVEAILKTWASQLFDDDPSKLEALWTIYQNTGRPRIDKYKDALRLFLQNSPRTYLLLDALDECESETRKEIPGVLQEFKGIKVLFTSRNEQDILDRVADSIPRITISADDNAKDIKLYLKHRVEQLRLKHKDLQTRIVEDVSCHANGMFLYARLLMDELQAKKTVKQIKESINILPKDLDTIYGKRLASIDKLDDENKRNGHLLLQWICEAMQPLTLTQIMSITTISDEGQLDTENELLDPAQFIHECCGSLVEISRNDSKVRFSHASVKDFLVSRMPTSEASFFVDVGLTHSVLARFCLAILSFDNVKLVDLDENRNASIAALREHVNNWPFLEYAVLYWTHHTLTAAEHMKVLHQAALRRFLVSNYHGTKWLQLIQHLRGDHGSGHTSEYYTLYPQLQKIGRAFEGISNELTWLRSLLQDKDFLRWHFLLFVPSVNYHPAISIAALFDYDDVVETELKRGVSANVLNWTGDSPLMLAAKGNSIKNVHLLLKHGAEPNQIGYGRHNALHYAMSWNGLIDPKVVSGIEYDTIPLLLEAKVNVHLMCNGEPLLHYVLRSEIEYPNIVKALQWILDAGGRRDMEHRDGDKMTALAVAARRGHKGCARLLLEYGANPDGQMEGDVEYSCSPLLEAAKKDDTTIGLMLLKAKAKINVREPRSYRTPLIEAVIRGSNLVKALLDAGADPSISDVEGRYPIHHAAIENFPHLIPLLLSRGSRLDVEDLNGQTPLDLATENGRTAAEEVLIKVGATPSVTIARSATLFPYASFHVYEMYFLLKQKTQHQVARNILIRIIDLAEYWISFVVSREDSQPVIIDNKKEEPPGSGRFRSYVISLPMSQPQLFPVHKIVMSTLSRDQGYSSYPQYRKSYDHCCSGFKLRIRRKVEIGQSCNEEEHQIVYNRHGWLEPKKHVVVWSSTGAGADIIRSLSDGDVLELVPWTKYPGWENHIHSARLEVFYSCLTLEPQTEPYIKNCLRG